MKKVLIITYYWPPAGGPGVQRWLKFVKYLPEYGIKPIVYVPENPDYPFVDPSFLAEVPENVRIIKNRIFEPYSLAKLFSKKETSKISSGIIAEEKNQNLLQKAMLYIRGNIFIPDARKFWINPSVKFLSEFISEENIDTVITTGPPHSLHLVGLKLKKNKNIKWIADFRDPWTNIGYHKKLKLTKKSEKRHRELEQEVINNATHIITTSYTTHDEFAGKTRRPVTVITNGFDEEIAEAVLPDKKFSISHIGSLLSGRNPENLWQVLSEISSENSEFAKDLEIKLVGAVSEEVIETLKVFGLQDQLNLKGYVDHKEALKIQRKSSILLLIEINSIETRGIIPGKLFEYLAAKRPILALGPQQWDVQQILEETNSGMYFDYSAKADLKEHLLLLYGLFCRDELKSEAAGIEKYSRKNLTARLAKLIREN